MWHQGTQRTFCGKVGHPQSIRTYFIMDNGPQFVFNFFAAGPVRLGVKLLVPIAHHSHVNDQAASFNQTIVVPL